MHIMMLIVMHAVALTVTYNMVPLRIASRLGKLDTGYGAFGAIIFKPDARQKRLA